MQKRQLSAYEKMKIVTEILSGKASINSMAVKWGKSYNTIADWIRNYQVFGYSYFIQHRWTKMGRSQKIAAVEEYLAGKGSLITICKEHKIKSTRTLRSWIKKYNSHEKLMSSGIGAKKIMTKGRNTTFEERIEIVKDCIANYHDYNGSSQKYKISYQQARNYTLKYESHGVEALKDNRGKRKSVEQMSEVEKLRAENKLLRAQKEYAEMEAAFLKKLAEVERRRD